MIRPGSGALSRHMPFDLQAPNYFANRDSFPTCLASEPTTAQIAGARRVIAEYATDDAERVEFERMLGISSREVAA